jgi:hypothetical protein
MKTGWGFSTETIQWTGLPDSIKFKLKPRQQRHTLKFYDLGGESKIRGIWPHYLPEVIVKILQLCLGMSS